MHTVNTIPLNSDNLADLPPHVPTKLLDQRMPRRFLRRLPGQRVFSVHPDLGCPSRGRPTLFGIGGVQ